MNEFVLNEIVFRPELASLLNRLRIREGSSYVEDVKRLICEARLVGRPKAFIKVGHIESKGEDWVSVEGTRLTSRILRVNLEGLHRVFAYVATCGTELDEWAESADGLLEQYWADAIKEMALRSATRMLQGFIVERFSPGRMSSMAPGSLADWPLTQQRQLFAVLGDPEKAIGVQLKDSCLMVPNKSVSGVRFAIEESFESCQLCAVEDCPGRRAPHDSELYDRKYRVA